MIPFIIFSWSYEDVIILFQFLDLDDLEPLDEEAIKKKMEEINEMFDVSGMIYHQRRCQFYSLSFMFVKRRYTTIHQNIYFRYRRSNRHGRYSRRRK